MSLSRPKILLFSLYLVFFLVASRFFYWQIIRSSDLREKALNQAYKLEIVPASRGEVYARDGRPLVLNQTFYHLSIYKPNLKSDLSTVIRQIAAVNESFVPNNRQIITDFSQNENQLWYTFKENFNQKQYDSLKNIPGLSFDTTTVRFYPQQTLALPLLGKLAANPYGRQVGFGGLEAYYQKQLEGKSGFSFSAKDATGKITLSQKTWQKRPLEGRNLHLSLISGLQYLSQKALRQGLDEYDADSGSIIIMQPKTGEILAMTSLEASPSAASIRNPAITDLFEPGSIFKPLVMAMALDNGSINSSYICTGCNRPRTIGDDTINNWNEQTYPDSTLYDIILHSDNIGMSYIIDRLGLDSFLEYYQRLGLHQRTGIDLQGEAKPNLKSYWSPIDLATASFGQGFAVTPIQMLRAFNVLAADGLLVTPHLLEYFDENDQRIGYRPPSSGRPIYSQATTDLIDDILQNAVEHSPISHLKPSNLEVCAKSGTAQIAIGGHYTDSATIASYIGYAPCSQPKFSMLVTINNPKSSPWGSSTAAPIWFNLASDINNLL